MVAQVHPFKTFPEKKLPWDGVHAPHPLRDDPSHPHSKIGDDFKNTFADGGIIPHSSALQNVAAAVESQVSTQSFSATGQKAGAAQAVAGTVPPLPAAPRRQRPRSRGRQGFTDGGKVEEEKKENAEDKQTSGTEDLSLSTATSRLKGRALKLLNAERAAEGLPPLTHAEE